MVELYALTCPDTGEIRYIGKAVNAQRRLSSHLAEKRRKAFPVYCWIDSLRKHGKVPGLVVLERVPDDGWQQHEIRLIAHYRAIGARLLNVADGGDQPKISREQRAINGRNNAAKRDPIIWRMQMDMGQMLHAARKRGVIDSPEWQEIRRKLRYCAWRRPELFGKWANA